MSIVRRFDPNTRTWTSEGSTQQIIMNNTVGLSSDVYDPCNIKANAFSMNNMVECENAKILTAAEREKIKEIDSKVTAVDGMGLSENNYTNDDKNKVNNSWNKDNLQFIYDATTKTLNIIMEE